MMKGMKLSFFMATRAVARGNRKAAAFTACVMTVLFINMVLLPALMDEMDRVTKSQIINKHLGHVLIEPEEDQETIGNVSLLKKKLYAFPEVRAVSAHYVMPATVYYKDSSRSGSVYFIEPREEELVTQKVQDTKYGEFLSSRDTDYAVVGAEAAGIQEAVFKHISLGLETGDKILIRFPGLQEEYRVKGIFHTKLIEADWDVYLTLYELERLFGISDTATQVIVRLRDDNLEQEFIKNALRIGMPYEFSVTREKQGIVLTDTLGIIKNIIVVVSLLVSLAALFIVIYIDAVSKRKIIAIMRSIGVRKRVVAGSFMLQSLFYAAAGSAAGLLVLYLVLVPYFESHPLDLPFAYVSLKILPAHVAKSLLLLFATAAAAGIIPVLHLYREKIVSVLRNA